MRLITKRVNRSFGGDVAIIAVLAAMGAFMGIPLVFAIGNAFKPLDEIWIFPPRFFPMRPTMQNFKDLSILMANSWVPFSRYIFNTLFITAAGTIGHIILASMCAYPLAKKIFPGSKAIFQMIVLSLMFHASVTAIPNYLILSLFGWIDTYLAIIVPAFAFPLGLYLMKQFMEQIPDAILEAAHIDGAREWTIFWRIVMPMVKPAWMTLIIFSVQALWGIGSNVFIYSEELKTMSYALNQILEGGIARAGVAGAVTLIMMSVPILVFLVTQSKVIETMSASGLKE